MFNKIEHDFIAEYYSRMICSTYVIHGN